MTTNSGEKPPSQAALFADALNRLEQQNFRRLVNEIVAPAGTDQLTIRYTKSRSLLLEPDFASVTMRTSAAEIVLNGQTCGAMFASVLRSDGDDQDAFHDVCDGDSEYLLDVARIITRNWNFEGFPRRRDMLILDRIVVNPEYERRGLMRSALAPFLEAFSPNPLLSILRAFPLGYERIGQHARGFTAAAAGLVGYYEKAGYQLLPNQDGAAGWMHRPTARTRPLR